VSEDAHETGAAALFGQNREAKNARAAAADGVKKERLAAALRENLKRRKAQTLARREETTPNKG
jgi:hypothetical protein